MPRVLFAVVVDSLAERHQSFVAGLREVLRTADAELLVVVSHPSYPRRGKLLRELASSGRLAGVVLTRMHDQGSGANRSAAMVGDLVTVPLLTYDFQVPDVGHVGRPRSAALAAGVGHLAELGRTRIAVLSDVDVAASVIELAVRSGLPRPRLLEPVRGPISVTESLAPLLNRRADGSWAFDGLMATDDDLSLAAIGTLRAQGLEIPGDVAVVGAGNTAAAARHDPPLSSVEESLHALGEQAGQLLLRQAQAPTYQPTSARPTSDVQVVVRSSTAGVVATTALGLTTTIDGRPAIRLPATPDQRGEEVRTALDELRGRFFSAVVGGTLPDDQVDVLGREVDQLVARYPDTSWWASVLDAVRRDVALTRSATPARPHRADAVGAQLELGVERVLNRERAGSDRVDLHQTQQLLDLVQALSDAREPATLFHALSEYLPRIGVRSCFLARPVPSDDGLPMVELAFSHRRGRTDAPRPHDAPYPARRLVPERLDTELDGGAWVMQPLFHDQAWAGFLLTDQSRTDHRVTEALRHGISRALADIERARLLTQRAHELEVVVQARTAELRYEAATRQAAQEALSTANVQLREAMLRDSLTTLQNRASLDSRGVLLWEQHTVEATPLSILMVDVDHFKAYNDRYGHAAGDECLRSIARCLTEVTRRSGDFVARYGGEEFVVLMPDTDADGAARVADELLASVRGAGLDHVDGIGRRVSVSIGVATSTPYAPLPSLPALFTAADQALYRAKDRGRDRSHVAPSRRPGDVAVSADPVHPAEGVLGAAVLHVDQRLA